MYMDFILQSFKKLIFFYKWKINVNLVLSLIITILDDLIS